MSVTRLRYLLRPREVTNRTSLQVLSVYRDHGVIPKDSRSDNFNKTPEDIARYQEVRVGDLVVNKMKAWQGSVGISAHHGIVSPDYLVCAVDSTVNSRFMHHLLRSKQLAAEFGAKSKGIRPAQWRLYWEDLAEISVTIPPTDEQRRVADFLDAETARIDRLAKLRASQAETLWARYQSHLSEVAQVLSDRHGTVKVRHVLQRIEQGWSPQCEDRPVKDDEWGVVKAGCMNGGVFDVTQHKALPAGATPELRYRLRAGDVLMSRASGSVDLIGSIAVFPHDLPSQLLLCDKVYRLRMDRTRMTPYFTAFMLRTLQVREQIKLGISGAEGMANNLPTATVTNLPLPDAPLTEQANIVKDLDGAWQTVQETRQKLSEQLKVLAERRQALITAAVMGQVDVATATGGEHALCALRSR
jgi:type I restriction enzyme S subunit